MENTACKNEQELLEKYACIALEKQSDFAEVIGDNNWNVDMGKGEISWNKTNHEGKKFQVYAHRIGDQWSFFFRPKRFDEWEQMNQPPLEDCMESVQLRPRRHAFSRAWAKGSSKLTWRKANMTIAASSISG